MNIEEATFKLTKELAKKDLINIADSSMIPYFLQNSNSAIAVKKSNLWKPSQFLAQDTWEDYMETSHYEKQLRELRKKELEILKEELPQANYVFTTTNSTLGFNNQRSILFTQESVMPFAIISRDETEMLKKIYKGDLPEDVEEAANTIGIDLSIDYINLYENDEITFREYFSTISFGMREKIVKQIFESGKTNAGINKWLETGYNSLIRYVGSERIKKEEAKE